MKEPTHGAYEIEAIDGIDALRAEIKEMYESEDSAAVLADLLMNGHDGSSGYLVFGNNKVSKNTGIFNMNAATDCPNADTTVDNQSDTGVCQVPWSACYAHKTENIYDDALNKRRLQEYLWDCVTPEIFAEALLRVKERKRTEFSHVRVSESGDFRHNGDIKAWDRIAEIVGDSLNIYTYSASHKLSAWGEATHFTVNQSNDLADYGDRQFSATYGKDGESVPIESIDDVPEGWVTCPFEKAKANGVDTEDRPKCGECTACILPSDDQPKNVAVIQH